MATIQCRYEEHLCRHPEGKNKKLNWDEMWFCDSEDCCDIAEGYTRPGAGDVVNPTCVWSRTREVALEKSGADYEYIEGEYLKVGRKTIRDFDIAELKIDGRTIIADEKQAERAEDQKMEDSYWFRVYTANRGALNAIDDQKVGDALKAALTYFDRMGADESIEANITDPETRIAFGIFKQGADDSIEDIRSIERAKERAREKK